MIHDMPDHAPARSTDPGSPKARTLALATLVALVAVLFALQQSAANAPAPAPAAHATTSTGADDPYAFAARLVVKITHAAGIEPPAAGLYAKLLDDSALNHTDQLRNAVVAAQLAGPQQALSRLDDLAERLDRDNKLPAEQLQTFRDDLEALRTVYAQGPQSLEPAQAQRLKDRHGWFATLALHWNDESAPARQAALAGGTGLIALLLAFIAGAFLVVGLVIASLIWLGLAYHSGRLTRAFRPPTPGGSVYLETVAVFFAAFLALKLATSLLAPYLDPATLTTLSLALQWLVLAAVAWPLARGVSVDRWRHDLGLHTGRGLLREIAAGLVGYFAGLVLLALALAVTITVVFVKSRLAAQRGETPEHPTNAVFELATSGGWTVVLFFTLATIWAPLAEETAFRGCLYRHCRSRAPVLIAAALSAAVFAAAHGYQWFMLLQVATLGLIFGLIREWRDSLVGPIAAHALHNTTVLALLLSLLSLAGD